MRHILANPTQKARPEGSDVLTGPFTFPEQLGCGAPEGDVTPADRLHFCLLRNRQIQSWSERSPEVYSRLIRPHPPQLFGRVRRRRRHHAPPTHQS